MPKEGSKVNFNQLAERHEQARLGFLHMLQHQQEEAKPEQTQAWQREIFDVSRQIGLEQIQDNEPWSTKKIALFLSASGIPCVGGEWEYVEKGLWQLARQGCDSACDRVCHYWQEAADGLVMGLGDSARYARHQCRANGDPQCVDVLYDRPLHDQRWGSVPADMLKELNTLEATFSQHQFRVEWLGYATGTLYYKLHDNHSQLASHRYENLITSIAKEIQRHFPELKIQEVSPRAVWQGE